MTASTEALVACLPHREKLSGRKSYAWHFGQKDLAKVKVVKIALIKPWSLKATRAVDSSVVLALAKTRNLLI